MSRQLTVAAAMAIACVACSGFPGGSKSAKGGVATRPDSIRVDVVNENYYAARIHAIFAGGQRRTMGTIDGNGGRATVALEWQPRSLVFELLLITDGSTYVTWPVDPSPGDSIELRVPPNISGSGFFRRVRRP